MQWECVRPGVLCICFALGADIRFNFWTVSINQYCSIQSPLALLAYGQPYQHNVFIFSVARIQVLCGGNYKSPVPFPWYSYLVSGLSGSPTYVIHCIWKSKTAKAGAGGRWQRCTLHHVDSLNETETAGQSLPVQLLIPWYHSTRICFLSIFFSQQNVHLNWNRNL